MAKNWYVIRVKGGSEDSVKEDLKKRLKALGAEDKVPNVLVPVEKVIEMKNGKKSVKEKKLYPGYILVEMELDDKIWYIIRETPGIGDFLGLGRPIPMAKDEIEKILAGESEVTGKPKIEIKFKKGDTARVKSGPFENFDGVVEEVNTAKGSVTITITIFGRLTKVELEYWQLERI